MTSEPKKAARAALAVTALVLWELSGCSAAGTDPDPTESEPSTLGARAPDTTTQLATSSAAATGCPSITATLRDHAAAGRVTATTLNFIFFQLTAYSTPTDSLGFDGNQSVTLYETASGTYTTNATNCVVRGICGNGVVEQGFETCDGTDFAGATCQSMGFDGGGTLKCTPECKIDLSDSGCKSICGNGRAEPTEQCDGPIPAAKSSCTLAGPVYTGGMLGCRSDCTYDTSACQVEACGNAVAEFQEDCDGSDFRGKPNCVDHFANATGGTLKCTSACQFDTSGCQLQCGNGVLDADEQCDGSVFSSTYAGKSCTDFQFPSPAFPFGNRVNYGSGGLACNGCRVDFSACKPLPGCYYVTFKQSVTIQCF